MQNAQLKVDPSGWQRCCQEKQSRMPSVVRPLSVKLRGANTHTGVLDAGGFLKNRPSSPMKLIMSSNPGAELDALDCPDSSLPLRLALRTTGSITSLVFS